MKALSFEEIEQVASVCHAANSAFCKLHGDPVVSWEDGKQSSIDSVEFLLASPGAPDSAFHDAWCAQKRAAGWTYAPVRNNEKKEHPCLIPFEGLPLHQQAKDRLFKAIVHALAA